MTTRILTPLAALMLLLPAAAVLVPVPVAAQYRVAPAAPLIDSFDLRGGGALEPGREARFRLRGAPSGQAWVEIPGTARIGLSETRPGVYEGDFRLRSWDDVNAVQRAVGTLQASGQRASARVDVRGPGDNRGNRGGRDNAAPNITDLVPAEGARVDDDGRVRIAARLDDPGRRGAIDPQSITVRVDGRDVTRDARLRGDEVEVRVDLPRGRHTAEVQVRDQAGNVGRRAWSFDVVDRHARVVPVPVIPGIPVPLPGVVVPAGTLEITSHAVDAAWNLQQGTPIRGRTFPHATVRVLVTAVVDMGGTNMNNLVADATVRADAAGNFAVVPRPLPVAAPMTPTYYLVQVTATGAGQTAKADVRLQHR